jgi:hypothetical protein
MISHPEGSEGSTVGEEPSEGGIDSPVEELAVNSGESGLKVVSWPHPRHRKRTSKITPPPAARNPDSILSFMLSSLLTWFQIMHWAFLKPFNTFFIFLIMFPTKIITIAKGIKNPMT